MFLNGVFCFSGRFSCARHHHQDQGFADGDEREYVEGVDYHVLGVDEIGEGEDDEEGDEGYEVRVGKVQRV